MGSVPSRPKGEITKQGDNNNMEGDITFNQGRPKHNIGMHAFDGSGSPTNHNKGTDKKNSTDLPPVEDDFDDWDVEAEMTRLQEELDQILNIPICPTIIKKTQRVPEPLDYDTDCTQNSSSSSKIKCSSRPRPRPIAGRPNPKRHNLELATGTVWKVPGDLAMRELQVRNAHIIEKMNQQMKDYEYDCEEYDTSPWIQSMCCDDSKSNNPTLNVGHREVQQGPGFDTRKFKAANKVNKWNSDLYTTSPSSMNRIGSDRSTTSSRSVEPHGSRNLDLSYDSSEEALISSIENDFS